MRLSLILNHDPIKSDSPLVVSEIFRRLLPWVKQSLTATTPRLISFR